MSNYLCGGHPTSVFGTGANVDYFAVGAQNTVSVEFCRQMALLYDGGDASTSSAFGVAPDYLLGLSESQTPAIRSAAAATRTIVRTHGGVSHHPSGSCRSPGTRLLQTSRASERHPGRALDDGDREVHHHARGQL